MTPRFKLLHTRMTLLWDFGWFDLSRFRVEAEAAARHEWHPVLHAFLRDPISRKSFCRPSPWGEDIGHHGPFLSERLAADWFRPLDFLELTEQVSSVLDDPKWTKGPTPEQRRPVKSWLESVQARGDTILFLEAPEDPEVRLEWHWIWHEYHEFVCLSPDMEELTIAVIGYD